MSQKAVRKDRVDAPLPLLTGCVKRKLTPLQVRFIRDAYAVHMAERREQGFVLARHGSLKQLGERFGVAGNTIYRIIKRKKWRTLR